MTPQAVPVQFNHMGFTVRAETLRGDNLELLRSFFEEVFGFEERTELTREGGVLCMMAGGVDQFVIFFAHDTPLMDDSHGDFGLGKDHFGLRVTTRDELEELYRRAVAFRDRSGEGVELGELETLTFDEVVSYDLHRFFVRCGTPLAIEVQYYDFHIPAGDKAAAPA